METAEERQNQPKIECERITLQEIAKKGTDDRISELPDCLLIEILSRLPSTKEAITTGTLSKRWKHLWTLLPNLNFSHGMELWSDYVSLINKTLTQCRLKLQKFQVCSQHYMSGFEAQVNNCIRYAIRCRVEELNLTLWNMKDDFLLEDFFVSSCFTHLRLEVDISKPTVVIIWKNLRSLSFTCMKLNEDLIENKLSGSPQLETLVLDYCYGYSRLDITSKSVKNLELYHIDDNVELNAPNILSLTIESKLYLGKVLWANVPSLVEANIDYYINAGRENPKMEEEMLKGDIQNLSHVAVLKIGSHYFKVLSRLEAKGFVIPLNIF